MKILKQSEIGYYLCVKTETDGNVARAPPNAYFPPAKVWKLITSRIPNSFHGKKKKKAISLHHFRMWLKLLSS